MSKISTHPLYAKYHYMMTQGLLGKEWENFVDFALWCKNMGIEKDYRIQRLDSTKPFAPDNICIIPPIKEETGCTLHDRYNSMCNRCGMEGWNGYDDFEFWCLKYGVNQHDQIRRLDTSKPISPDNVKIVRKSAKGDPLHKRYYSMRRTGGVTEEWNNFQNFFLWCTKNGVKDGIQIRRRDLTKPFGPDNVYLAGSGVGVLLNNDPLYCRYTNMRERFGVDEKWNDFSKFSSWCKKNHITKTDRIMRLDRKKPFGPDNVWIAQNGITESPWYLKYIKMRHNGGVAKEWDSFSKFTAWCEKHGISPEMKLRRINPEKPFGPKNIRTDALQDSMQL